MKKSTKSTTTNKVQTPRTQRHTANKSKPVTIDLKAEEVAKKKTSSTPKVAKATKSSSDMSTSAKTTKADTKAEDSSAESIKPAIKSAKAETDKTKNNKPDITPSDPSAKSVPPVAPASKKGTTGLGGRLTAATIGGLIALSGAGLLQYLGILGSPASNQAAFQQELDAQARSFDQQIAGLKAQLSQSQNGVDLAAVDARIDEKVTQSLAELPSTEVTGDTDEIINQLNETTLRVKQLMTDQKANADQIANLTKALRTAESSGSGGAALSALGLQVENLTSQSTRIRDDVRQLKSDLAAFETPAIPAPLDDPEMVSRVSALEKQVGDLSGLTSRIDGLQASLDESSNNLQQQAAAIEHLRTEQSRPKSSDRLAARSVAAAALKNDIDRGLPFADTLGILKSLSDDDTALSRLDDFADSGIPTSSQLTASFESVSDAILAATQPEPADNLSSRLLAGVKSFVRVKARKPIEGTSPLAIVSQIAGALDDTNLQQALSLWDTLPEAGKAASSDWHAQLQSRIIADDLISTSVQSFLNSSATQ